MPIVRYRTGDRVDVDIPQDCECGSSDLKFVLRGRVEGQINIWSCRVGVAAIEKAIAGAGLGAPFFQVEASETTDATGGREVLCIRVPTRGRRHGRPTGGESIPVS